MILDYTEIEMLPKLAWIADVKFKDGLVNILHGSNVETTKSFFIEGAWSGKFSEGNFDTTDCIFGSGAVVASNRITFVSSTSTTDKLFYKKF